MATVTFKLTIVLLLAVVSVLSARKPWNECKRKSQLGEPCNDGTGTCTKVEGKNGQRYGQMECKPNVVDCGNPRDLPNGEVTLFGGTQVGDWAEFACNDGYFVMGTDLTYTKETCLETGEWTGESVECIPVPVTVDCGQPQDINPGTVDLSQGTMLGAEAHYTCDTPYTLVGESPKTCLSTGEWSGELLFCQP